VSQLPANLLEVDRLTVAFPGLVAVREASFAIAPAETLALVGESGCGKSVTAFSVMRLLPPNARVATGRIVFDGNDLMTASRAEMRRLSRRAARARAVDLLDLVKIPDAHRRVDDYPHNLSGGMRQRVMIAMAVACHPKLLIADEPTTALDVTTQAQVLDLLGNLRRELSMAVLLITHDLGVVAQWADRIAVMYAGRIVERASIVPFFVRPMHPYSHGLLGARVDVDAEEHYLTDRLTEIPGSVGSAAGEAGCSFAPRCPMVQPSCRLTPPPLLELADGRAVACPIAAARTGAPHGATVG
jgi:peptide/nickel transport system ATP-binding protein